MKKIFLTLMSLTLFFTNNLAFWYIFENQWSNFYSEIDESINNLEANMLTIQADNFWWNREEINKIASMDCLVTDLSETQLTNILYNWILTDIIDNLSDSCAENWNVSKGVLNTYLNAIGQYYNKAESISKTKTLQLYDIANMWVYSDWIDSNSPFDLIQDLKEIDSIVFMEETELYKWNNDSGLLWEISDYLDDVPWKIKDNIADVVNGDEEDIISNQNNSNTSNNNQEENFIQIPEIPQDNSVKTISLSNSYICSEENQDNWLNVNALGFLLSDISENEGETNNNSNSNYPDYNPNEPDEQIVSSIDDLVWIDDFISDTEYSSVNDNDQFPCDQYFCIDINFLTHEASTSTVQNISIEYLLNRSNGHLKKFANSSLIQSEMTVNNFELWFSNLSLPDIFHIWFQINYKPVPILDIKDEEEWEWIYSVDNQMNQYYDFYWLDYARSNDLSVFNKQAADKQITSISELLDKKNVSDKINNYSNYLEEKKEKSDTLSKSINEQTRSSIMTDFSTQFSELEIFNKSMTDYVNNLNKILINMSKIPES